MDHIDITDSSLSVDEASRLVTDATCGAISLFVGVTRDNFEGKTVVRLEYEAYKPMAVKEMKKICGEMRDKWPVKHIAMHHRTGLVPVTEASVIIAVSSPHRQDSLSAVQYGIDTLKARVPIWKKEVYADGDPTWKENIECIWKS